MLVVTEYDSKANTVCAELFRSVGLPHRQIVAFVDPTQSARIALYQALRITLANIPFAADAAATAPVSLAWWHSEFRTLASGGESRHPLLQPLQGQIASSTQTVDEVFAMLAQQATSAPADTVPDSLERVCDSARVADLFCIDADARQAMRSLWAACIAMERLANLAAGSDRYTGWLPMQLRAQFADDRATLLRTMAEQVCGSVLVGPEACSHPQVQYSFLCWRLASKGIDRAISQKAAACYPRSALWLLWRETRRLKIHASNQT